MLNTSRLRLAVICGAAALASPSLAAEVIALDLSTPDSDGYVFGGASFDWPPEGLRSQIRIEYSGLELIDALATGYVDAAATWWDPEIGGVTGNEYLFAFDCGVADGCITPVGPTAAAGYVYTPQGYDKPCGPTTIGNCSFHYTPSSGEFSGYFRVLNPASPYSVTLTIGDLTAVPEPATWAMLITGLAGLGITMRSRRQRLRSA